MDSPCPLCASPPRKLTVDAYACTSRECELYSATLSLEAWQQLSQLKN